MKRTCLQENTNTDEQNSFELNRRSPFGKICGTKWSKFHPVEQLFEKRNLDPKDNQFVKSFVRMKRLYIAFSLLIISISLKAQFGGETTYTFLNLSNSARVTALGGNQVGLLDSTDLNLSFYNPAMLMPSMHNNLLANYVDYFAGIKLGYISYARKYDKLGTFSVGMHYIDYGKFIAATETGEITGSFTASDYALNLIWSKKIYNRINGGINIKPIYSKYESYNSMGIAADFGLSYTDSAGLFSAGIVLKNVGKQFNTYSSTDLNEPIPTDLQAGFSQRLAHSPLRLSFTFNNLTRWNLTDKATWDYDNRESDAFVTGSSDTFLRQFMRHTVIGAELIPSPNFSINVGYNYQRRRELALESRPGLIGYSGGFSVKISKFRFAYSISSYHIGGTANSFSISTNLSQFGGKRLN